MSANEDTLGGQTKGENDEDRFEKSLGDENTMGGDTDINSLGDASTMGESELTLVVSDKDDK